MHYDVGRGGWWSDAVAMASADRDLAREASRAEHVELARRVDGRSLSPTP